MVFSHHDTQICKNMSFKNLNQKVTFSKQICIDIESDFFLIIVNC